MEKRNTRLLNSIKPLLAALLICFPAFWIGVRGQSAPNLVVATEPYVMRDDFQGDSLGQWASYPPAQDIGYEPSLTPTNHYGAPGGRALMRVVKPNVTGELRLGFIKKVWMLTSGDARVTLDYRVVDPVANTILELGLAGTNGILFTKNLKVDRNSWTTITEQIADFRDSSGRAPAAGTGIEAIYVVASLPQANPDTTYRFLIDNVAFAVSRAMRFNVSQPLTEAIEPWSTLVSTESYRHGGRIAIEARLPVRLARVDCTLTSPDGSVAGTSQLYDDGTHGDRLQGDDIWSNTAIYSIEGGDSAGIWTVQLNGSTVDGKIVNTTLRLLVHPAREESHPRLFFSASDRQKLIERSRDPKLAKLWSHLQSTAKNARATGELAHGGGVFEMLDSEYLLPSLLAYFDVLNRARSRIAYNALEAYLTDSEEALEAAKAAMLDVARWPRWQPPWFNAHGQHTYYPAGLLAADVAFGYDLLYDRFSESERSLIRKALIEKSIIPTYKEYVLDNRLMANTSNWIAHTVGGALIAATSIAGDVQTNESNGQFELYLHGLLLKLEDHLAASFLADGSYGEGISYQEFDLETLAPAFHALRRTFGIDYWKRSHVLDSLLYAIYTLADPASASLDMGDTHPPAGHGIPALVYESKDPVVRWYYSQFDRPSLAQFIFYEDTVPARRPTLPTSRIFRDKGNAVFRTGWGKDDLVFLYRAGPTFNHNHADQGSFLLTAFGEGLVTEAGWSDYYKDPHYTTFFTQAIGHSTVLVDGNPESQSIADTPQFSALKNYPRITDSVTSEFYDSVSSELAPVYQGRLERFKRSIVFIKPHYLVIFDDLSARSLASFQWLLHLPDRARVEVRGALTLYRREKAALAVQPFAPSNFKLEVRQGRVPYQVFAARTPATTPAQPAFLELSTEPQMNNRFLVALVPARTSDAARMLATNMSAIESDDWLGIRTVRGPSTDLVMFQTRSHNRAQAYNEWSTDATIWTSTEAGGQLILLAAEAARVVSRSGRELFTSDRPASFAARFGVKRVEFSFSVKESTQMRLFTGTAPSRLLLDGKDLSKSEARYIYLEGKVSITVPAGQHDLAIELR